MAQLCTTLHGMRAEFTKDEKGALMLEFFDAAYVRSDLIVMSRENGAMHAILEGGEHFIGHLDLSILEGIENGAEIVLSAPHYRGHTFSLKSQVSLRD